MSDDEVMTVARRAKCSRCKAVVVDEDSVVGTVMANYYSPATGMQRRIILCGACGLAFREFVHPEILDDPEYLRMRDALRAVWT